MIQRITKLKWPLLLTVAILLFAFIHLYRLDTVPLGMHSDEMSLCYDVYCLTHYGVDRNCVSYPAWFISYGDGMAPMLLYQTFLIAKLLGEGTDIKLIVRYLMAFFAFLTGLAGFAYCREKWPERKVSHVYAALFAIVPVFTMMHRIVVESHQMMFASALILLVTWYALKKDSVKWYVIAGITAAFGMYTYALALAVIPMFLFGMFLYVLGMKRLNVSKALGLMVPYFVISAPAFFVQILNMLGMDSVVVGPITFPHFPYYRIHQLDILHIFKNFGRFAVRLLSFDGNGYSSIPYFGNWYYFSIPFILLGLIKTVKETVRSLKSREIDPSVPMAAWLLASTMVALLVDAGYTTTNTQLNYFFPAMLYLLVQGLVWAWDLLREKGRWQQVFAIAMALAYLASFGTFAYYYFGIYADQNYVLCYETTEGVREYYNSPEGASASRRMTIHPPHDWLEGHMSLFYRYSYQLSPYEEFTIDENGHYRYGQDYVEYYPEHINLQANYVVQRTDTASAKALEDLGYELLILKGTKFYVSPLENYTETALSSCQIDTMEEYEEGIRITGWCYDETQQMPFAQVIWTADGREYTAETVARPDVAAAFGNENLTNAGFAVMLPKELFSADEIEMQGMITSDNIMNLYYLERD